MHTFLSYDISTTLPRCCGCLWPAGPHAEPGPRAPGATSALWQHGAAESVPCDCKIDLKNEENKAEILESNEWVILYMFSFLSCMIYYV